MPASEMPWTTTIVIYGPVAASAAQCGWVWRAGPGTIIHEKKGEKNSIRVQISPGMLTDYILLATVKWASEV